MPNYYVNTDAQSTGEHEVHQIDCNHGPAADKRRSIGWYSSCSSAIEQAKKLYMKVDGCYFCSNACHNQ